MDLESKVTAINHMTGLEERKRDFRKRDPRPIETNEQELSGYRDVAVSLDQLDHVTCQFLIHSSL